MAFIHRSEEGNDENEMSISRKKEGEKRKRKEDGKTEKFDFIDMCVL